MERRGVILGLQPLQIGVLGGILLFVIGMLFTQLYMALLILSPVLLLVAILGGGRWNRDPLITYLLVAVGFVKRTITKQNAAVGGPDAAGAYRRVGQLNLPGGLGSIELHEVEDGGAFTYDSARQRFTTTMTCSAPAWALEDAPEQYAAVAGFVRWLNGLTRIPGVVEIDVQIRADASASTALEKYVGDAIATRESGLFEKVECPNCSTSSTTRFCQTCGFKLRGESESPLAWVDEQARIAASNVAEAAQEFSYYITYAFDLKTGTDRRLAQRVKRGGGGMQGIASVVNLEVKSIARSLTSAGVSDIRWLDAADMTAVLRLGYDPETTIARERNGSLSRRQNPEMVRPMAMQEFWDHLRIDESFHQVFWITDWPQSDVPIGFLEELIASGGDYTRVITLQMIPVSKAKALRRIQQAQIDIDAAALTREKLGQRETREQSAEGEDISEREEDLAEGFRDMEFRGFVTVSAGSRELLDDARNGIEIAAQEAQLEVRPLYLQQAAAFNTAVLPLGIGTVKK